ncbi:MAG: hypothetical protein PVJ66_05675 [Gammaproteobacteria bacterium]|jgi:hypothetical protein
MQITTGAAVTAAQLDIGAQQLGRDDREFVLESRADVCSVADELARQARHSLLLITESLEPAVFDRQPFLDAAGSLARRYRDSHFWIVVQDARAAISKGHRLIELSRRLSTHIRIRRPAPHHRGDPRTYLLSDNAGYFNRPLSSRYEGTANFNDPGTVEVLKKHFMEIWEQGIPEEEMRRLYL